MGDWFPALVGMLSVFGASVLVSYAVMKYARPRPKAAMPPRESVVRIKTPDGIWRTRLASAGAETWWIHAPLNSDFYVPFSVGETLTLEVSSPEGVILFKSPVLARRSEDHTFEVSVPKDARGLERREHPRLTGLERSCVRVDRCRGRIVDISRNGAKLLAALEARRGQRVMVELPEQDGPVAAWVLETQQAVVEGSLGTEIRVRFEEPIFVTPLKKHSTSA